MSARGRIVVVDDDTEMNKATSRLLQVAGFHPTAFLSAEDLLADGAAEGAACLILDIHLPGMTGLELCRLLHGRGIVAPVIFITGYEDREMRAQARELGAIDFFAKPFAGSSLLGAVRRALRESHENEPRDQG